MHHRNQAADERRRRMLLDESCSSMPAHSSSSTDEDRDEAARAKRSYTSAARSGRQPRLIDLVPKRWPVFLAHLAVGALVIAGVDWLARHASAWSETFTPQQLAFFEPAALGSLARWLASLWLLTAAALAVIIYTVRRHKADDYRGGYRTWLWATALLVLASFDAATSAHRLLGALLVHQFGTPLGGNGAGWWLGTWGLLLGLVGLRLTIDMRASRAALTAALLAAACYAAVALTVLFPGLLEQLGQSQATADTVLLAGHLCWLTALAYNARFVFLDAQGLIAAREPRASRREARENKQAAKQQSAEKRKTRRTNKKAAAASDDDDTADDTTDEAAEAKPRRFLFWTIRSAEEREAARREKEDERELRREAKLEARREARENKQAARAEKQAARDARRSEREEQQAERKSQQQERQQAAAKSSPLSSKVRQARDGGSSSSDDGQDDDRHLSKAERKRLKKERRRQLRDQAA